MFRRLLGVVILLVSLILVVFLLWGAFTVGHALDSFSASLDTVLALTLDTLNNVTLTLEQTRSTVVEANNALDTASTAAANISQMMSDMQPVLAGTTKVVTEDVPANIEAVQDTIPNIVQVAAVIDNVLRTLSNFGIQQTIPIPFNPITIDFDLGIDYAPAEPFDDTIRELDTSLQGMPAELRSLRTDLEVLSSDLEILTSNIENASGDIANINQEVAGYLPIIDEYIRLVDQIIESLSETRGQLVVQLEMAKVFAVGLLVFLSLSQLAPLYLGWELVTGKRYSEAPPESSQGSLPAKEQADEISSTDVEVKSYEVDEIEYSAPVEEIQKAQAETVIEQPQEIGGFTEEEEPGISQTDIDGSPSNAGSEDDPGQA